MVTTAGQAETLALRALSWMATEADLLEVFVGSSGIDADDLRARAADPDFLGAVLDFLLMDDAWIIAFCDAEGLPREAPQTARRLLPGGAEMHWT